MSQILFANNAKSTLAGAISNVAVVAQLAVGSGALFPSPGAGQYFVMTFTDVATGLLNEIVHVTNRVGDVITIVRGQEGTAALPWSAGDLANNRLTAGQMSALQQTDTVGRTVTVAGPIQLLPSDVNVFVDQVVPAAITLLLPADPSDNQEITVYDDAGDAATYNITVNGNGNPINAFAGNLYPINQDYGNATFVWNAQGTAWRIKG